MDAVTQVLLDRSHQIEPISRNVAVSFAAHALLVAAIVVGPAWFGAKPAEHAPIMMISFSGAPGPIQGHNPESPKPVQQVAPPVAKPQPEAPPALSKPDMVEPIKKAKPLPKTPAKSQPEKPTEQLHGRTPTQGAEIVKGTSRFETKSTTQTPVPGLGTGGNGTPGAYTEVADFCCPEYLQTMQRIIYGNWQQHQGVDGSSSVKFTILRDGTITAATVEQSSNPYLNLPSMRALQLTPKLPPLPAAFTGDHLTVHLVFQYKR